MPSGYTQSVHDSAYNFSDSNGRLFFALDPPTRPHVERAARAPIGESGGLRLEARPAPLRATSGHRDDAARDRVVRVLGVELGGLELFDGQAQQGRHAAHGVTV